MLPKEVATVTVVVAEPLSADEWCASEDDFDPWDFDGEAAEEVLEKGLREIYPNAREIHIEEESERGTLAAANPYFDDDEEEVVVWIEERINQDDPLWHIYEAAAEAGIKKGRKK